MRELMELTPCDIFPYLRGRTIWLVGDSMMQVQSTGAALSLPCQAPHQTFVHRYIAGPSGCSITRQCNCAEQESDALLLQLHHNLKCLLPSWQVLRCIGVLLAMPVSMTEGKVGMCACAGVHAGVPVLHV